MMTPSRLPRHFPVGTKFVIEGSCRGAGEMQIYSRYLEFPDGSLIRLPARPPQRQPARRHSRGRRRRQS